MLEVSLPRERRFYRWLGSTLAVALACLFINSCQFRFDFGKTELATSIPEFKELGIDQFKTNSLDLLKPSSLWCSSGDVFCQWENVCFNIASREIVYLFEKETPGIDNNFGTTCSVVDHNWFHIRHYVAVPFEMFATTLNSSFFFLPGDTLAMSRFKPDNIMHAIHDDLLPLFATIFQHNLAHTINRIFFIDNWNASHGQSLFQWLPFDRLYEKQFEDSFVCFERFYTGMSSSTVWYQYGFTKPQAPIALAPQQSLYIRQTIKSIRSQMFNRMDLNTTCAARHALLFVRKQTRKILNHDQLHQHLETKYGPTKIIMFDKQTFADMKKLFAQIVCASAVIGMHGSELSLAVFMPYLTTLIEIFPHAINPEHYKPYRAMSEILGVHYKSWVNPIGSNSVYHPEYPTQWGGLLQLSASDRQDVLDHLNQSLGVHLCCDNPHWLYRIYQDTIVDLELFAATLEPTGELETRIDYRLSYVQSIECTLIGESQLKITWTPPWNTIYLGDMGLSYQVMLQPVKSKQASVMHTTNESIHISSSHLIDECRQAGCNVWVKPVEGDLTSRYRLLGAYGSRPYLCNL